MIDLHSHILPELDDGSQSLQESLVMARMAVDSGITAMVATPHCIDDRTQEVYDTWVLLTQAIRENQIPLKLCLGMEIFGTTDTVRLLKEKRLFTLNGSRYPLVEFSFQSNGEEETYILKSLRKAGYRPVIAHPERYAYLQRNPKLANLWHRMGCLMQVNRGSLLGRFGRSAQSMGVELVERGFATVVATDAHSPEIRTPWMRDIREVLAKEVSPQCAKTLLLENPRKILKNEPLAPVEPDWF